MKNIFLYFSAFVPMYCLVLVKFIVGTISKTIDFNFLTIFTFVIFSILTALGIVGLIWNKNSRNVKTIKIKIVSANDITHEHFLSYFSLFVLYALSFELTKPSMLTISFVIIVLIGIVYINNKMFYINPLLNILGFNFYEVECVENEKPKKMTLFCKGTLENKIYTVKLLNENFAFINKTK